MLRYILLCSLRLFIFTGGVSSLWVGGLVLFTHFIPSLPHEQPVETDGIVVFTGGKARLQVAFNLFTQKKGRYLLISGVSPDSTLPQIIAQMPFKSHVTLGYNAHNTVGNAEETADWVHQNHIKSLRLITSNYHMPRSLFEVHALLPDIQIFPHPIVGESFLNPKWWLEPSALQLVVQEYNKFLFALVRHAFEKIQIFFQVKE